jgi:flavin reductase (DIM6/NTAB) family NADH-FMN oxidoreductase RutF
MDLKALIKIQYGMYVVSSIRDGKPNGQIANTVFQVTSEPPRIAVSLSKQNLTHAYIAASNVFSVSVLAEETPFEFFGKFGFRSGATFDKFKDTRHKTGVTGTPIVLENAVACLEARVTGRLDVGTHTIFVGEVVAAEVLSDAPPMTYEYYHRVKRGNAPKTAPTYDSGRQAASKEKTMKKYRCLVCGYIYDPEKGDAAGGIQPGTPFESLPESWVCPVCGAPKSAFEPVE